MNKDDILIQYMDDYDPEDKDYAGQKNYLAVLTHFTYFYARVSRALDYKY